MNRTPSFWPKALLLAASMALSAVPAQVLAQVPMERETQVQPVPAPVDQDRIVAAMQIDLLAEVLAAEVARAGDPFGPDAGTGGGPDAGWVAIVERVAPAERIRAGLREGIAHGISLLDDSGESAAVGEALSFWEADFGRNVVLLEIAARRAMSAPDIEAAARDAFSVAAAHDRPRAAQVRALVEAADLVEPAVAASLSIALATLRGAQEAVGAIDSSIIEDAWLQEPEIRADQSAWIEALLFMASAPLTDAEVSRLIEAAGQPGHRRLGTILNEAASETFVEIARDLGRASALRQLGERL